MISKSVVFLMGFLVSVSFGFLFLLSPTPVNATTYTYYVSPAGDDVNNSGLSPAASWKTIQKAANTMVAGDTTIVLPGTYSERVQVTKSGSSGLPITFKAQYPVVDNQINQSNQTIMKGFVIGKTGWDSVNAKPVYYPTNFIIVAGFEIANTDYQRWNGQVSAGVFILGSDNVVENNYIHDCPLNGILLYDTPPEPTLTNNNTISNNKLFRDGMAGIEVTGKNNLIEGNEVWETQQCPPALIAVEDAIHPGLTCNNYNNPKFSGLDSDGMRFFGSGHIFRKNYIHDIHFGPPGINPSIGDYVDDSHIDCFQTWTGKTCDSNDVCTINNNTAANILFEQNFCDNLQSQAEREGGQGFMIEGLTDLSGTVHVPNLTIRNNIIKAFRGINAIDTTNLIAINNIFVNDLTLTRFSPGGIGFSNSQYPIVKNNIFYNQPSHTITIANTETVKNTYNNEDIDYNAAYNSDNSIPDCVRVGSYVCRSLSPNDKWHLDPLFVDPANDFRLKSNSPLINSGFNLGALVSNDYDNVARPKWEKYDIGPFEYNGTAAPNYTPPVNTCLAGLVGYWPLDSVSNNQTLDLVGTDHGFVLGATQVFGKVNGALRFNSNDDSYDYINAGDSQALNITGNALSLEAWVNFDATTSARGVISKDGYGSGYRLLIVPRGTANTVSFQITGSSRTLETSSAASASLLPNQWYHIVATYDGSAVNPTMNIYVNGVSKASKAATGLIDSTTNNLWIGHGAQSTGDSWTYPFKGIIDEVAVYNRTLSSIEIINHYNNGNGRSYCSADITPTPSSVPCFNRNLGNLSCDPGGLINETDLGILLDKWDTPGADLSGDNLTDATDLSILLSNWKTQ